MAAHTAQWHGLPAQWRRRAWDSERNATVPARPRRHEPRFRHRCRELRLQRSRWPHKPMTLVLAVRRQQSNALRTTGPRPEAGKPRSRRTLRSDGSSDSDYSGRVLPGSGRAMIDRIGHHELASEASIKPLHRKAGARWKRAHQHHLRAAYDAFSRWLASLGRHPCERCYQQRRLAFTHDAIRGTT